MASRFPFGGPSCTSGGIGRALVDAVLTRDYTTVQFMVIVFAITALTANLIIDLVHIYLDPRINSIATDKATGT